MTLAALTRSPGPRLGEGLLTFKEREPVDVERALEQHREYRRSLEELGFRVAELPPQPDAPDAPFVEDPAIVLDDVAILTRPVAERLAELPSLATELEKVRPLERLEAPCLLEGGDVLVVDDVLYVSMGTRTNHAGLKALAHLVLPYGCRVKAVEKRGALHLKTACTWLGGDRLLANPDWVDVTRFAGFEILSVAPEEPFAGNVICVGEVVLVPAAFPRTADELAGAGLRVVTVDISEFQKMEAGLTCLSLLFRTEDPG